MCPGFDPGTPRHMWIEFIVGSLACSERFFSGYSAFPSLQKPAFSNSNSIWIIVKHFIVSLWLGWSRKHSLCLTLNLQYKHFFLLVFVNLHCPLLFLGIGVLFVFWFCLANYKQSFKRFMSPLLSWWHFWNSGWQPTSSVILKIIA